MNCRVKQFEQNIINEIQIESVKKLLSIFFAFLILLSGMHFSIATHYCGGELADSKASFSGGLASCGMECPVGQCSNPGYHLDSNCCQNKVSAFSVDHNFAPSFSGFSAIVQNIHLVFIESAKIQDYSFAEFNILSTYIIPPGNKLANEVSLPEICIFRI